MAVSFGSITSANTTFTITIAGLFSAPQQIQQYKVEDAFDSEAVNNGEIVKGVDNFIAAGWLPTLPKLNVSLMANSPSNDIFDQWFQEEQQQMNKLIGQGIITVPGISTQYTLINAYLSDFMHVPGAKKTMEGRKFSLILDDISYSPI